VAHVGIRLFPKDTRRHGDDDGGRLHPGQFPDGGGGLEATHLGHVDVHQDQVPLFIPHFFESDAPILGLADGQVVQFTVECVFGDDDVEGVVLGDQDAQRTDFACLSILRLLNHFSFGNECGKGKGKRGPFTFNAFHPDDTALQFDNLL